MSTSTRRLSFVHGGFSHLRKIAFLLCACASVLFAETALAQGTFTWNGGGTGNFWKTNANWSGGSAPGNLQNNIHFAGSTKTLNTNDFTDGATTTLGNAFRIFFDSGASSFTIRGGGIKVFDFGGNRARIQNDSSNVQIVELRRVGSGNAAGGLDVNANAGDIIINCQDTTFFDDPTTPTKQTSQLRFDGNAGKTVTYNARIQDGNTTASLAIRSNTIVILTAPNNSYSLGTFLDAGQLWLSTNATVAGTINIGPTVSRADNASVFAQSAVGGQTVTNAITIRSGGSGTLTLGGLNTSGEQLFSGAVTLQKSATLQAGTGGSIRLTGGVSETTVGSGVTAGSSGNAGTIVYDSAMTYTGPTTISFGTLKLNAANRISDSSALSIASGATFDMNNNNETVGSIAGAGSILMGSGQLIAGQDNSSTSFTGVASDTGSGSFVKKGTGTLTFGGANTYSGNTFVVGGTLSFTVAQDAAFTGTLNVGETSGTDAATLAIGTGGVTISNPITVRTGSSGTMTIAANNTTGTAAFSGAVTMNKAATLSANAGGNLLLNNSISLNANRLTVVGANNTSLDGSLSGTGDLLKQGTGTLSLNNSNSFGASNAVFADNGTIQVNAIGGLGATDGSTTGYVNLGASGAGSAGNITLSISNAGATVANPIDVRYFSAAPSGKTIAANNTSGSVTFTGPLVVHDSVTISAATGGTVTFSGDVGIAAGNTGSQTNSTDSTLFDPGPGVIKTGGGTLEFTGNNTLPNETYVKAGTLQYNGSGTYPSKIRLGDNTASSTVTVNIANASGGGVVTGLINTRAGAGGTKTISGSNTSGVNTYGGGVFLDAPVMVSSANSGATLLFTNASFDIKGNALTVAGNGDTEIRGNISNSSGTGSVVKNGNGTLRLKGANTYSGTTTVNAGTLNVGGSLGTGAVSIASSATLAGSGNIAGPVTLDGTVSAGNSVGQLSTGPQTWNGSVTNITEIIDAAGAAGAGYDNLNISGGIDLQATSGNKFSLKLVSLDGTGAPGGVTNFDNNTSYAWAIATTSGGVTNFAADKISVDTSAFANDLAGGEFLVESGSLNVRFTNNHAPVALTFTQQRFAGGDLKIKIADLLALQTNDQDGDARELTIVSGSTNNAAVSTNGTYILYSHTNNANDSFTYSVRDVRSAYRPGDTVRTATATIIVEVLPAIGSNAVVSLTQIGAGTNALTFAGIPGYEYITQFATNMNTSPWFDLSTNVAGTNGIWSVIDDTATNDMRFYRSMLK